MNNIRHKPLHAYAKEIRAAWTKVSPAALPYLNAMSELDQITEMYHADSAVSVVMYFLANASTFKGDVARRVKADLNEILKMDKRGVFR